MKNLNHPGIPKIYDIDEDENYMYIIEEFIPGQSLKDVCNSRLLSESEIFHFAVQISEIIHYLHSQPDQIIYLDLKPENIIINDGKCFLIDFGSARLSSGSGYLNFGSVSYASPEQLKGEAVGTGSDIYSLGRLLLYLVENGNTDRKKSGKLQHLANRCLASKSWNRIGTAGELVRRLKALQKNNECKPCTPVRTAIAGSSSNAGTTYTALLLSIFLAATEGKCTLVETYDSGLDPFTELPGKILPGRNLIFMDSKHYETESLPDGNLILDCGTLTDEMPDDFYKADCCCILVGNKAWEKDKILRARALSQKCVSRLFLVNLSDSVTDETAALLKGENFMAVPFIAGCGDILTNPRLRDIFNDIVSGFRRNVHD